MTSSLLNSIVVDLGAGNTSKQILLVDHSTKSCVNTSYQSKTVSGSHLEVGVKKKLINLIN